MLTITMLLIKQFLLKQHFLPETHDMYYTA